MKEVNLPWEQTVAFAAFGFIETAAMICQFLSHRAFLYDWSVFARISYRVDEKISCV